MELQQPATYEHHIQEHQRPPRASLASEDDCARYRKQPDELMTFLLTEEERTACHNAGNRLLHDYHLRECGRDDYAPGSDKCTCAKVSVAAYRECGETYRYGGFIPRL